VRNEFLALQDNPLAGQPTQHVEMRAAPLQLALSMRAATRFTTFSNCPGASHDSSSFSRMIVCAPTDQLSTSDGPGAPEPPRSSSTNMVYIARHLLGFTPVPPTFRVVDPDVPSDADIAARIDALCP